MKQLLEFVLQGGFLMDCLGVLGLGLVGLAAARLSARDGSKSGAVMSIGAVILLIGRLWILLTPSFFTPSVRSVLGVEMMAVLSYVPTFLMTSGLGAVVWGFWGYEKGLREAR